MKKKIIALLMAVLMLGCSAAGCSKDKADPGSPDSKQEEADGKVTGDTADGSGEAVEKPTILTGIYRGTSMKLEEGENLSSSVSPYIDKDSGEILFITSKNEEFEEKDEAGETYYRWKVHYYALKVDSEMNILERNELTLEDGVYLNRGVLTKDSVFFVSEEYSENTDSSTVYLNRYNLATGEITTSNPLNTMFESTDGGWFYVDNLVTDADGNIYLSQSQEICVLNSEFVKQYSVMLSDWINSMSSSPDGRVFVSMYSGGGYGLFEIDKEARQLKTEPVYSSTTNISGIMFGDGYDMYIANNNGIYGKTGENEPELLFNYMNSDIDSTDFEPFAVVDKDNFLVQERSIDSEGYSKATASLYKKSDDIDLSKIKVFDIAAPNGVNYDLRPVVIAYNKSHKDSRINVTDYSQYRTKEDYTAGITKLGTDLANGLYKPDIIILSNYNCEKIQDFIIKNNAYVDFNTLLADEPEILEDMFGGAKRVLSTSDGKLWGIAKLLNVTTLLTNSPELMDKESWTLDEMLEYNKTLPEGTSLMFGFFRDYFFMPAAGFFYNSFVNMDEYTCDFENETFYELLEYIVSLPTREVYQQQLDQMYSQENENRYEQYQTGKVALYSPDIYDVTGCLENEMAFNTKEYNAIGYPTDTGYGSMAQVDTAFVITTWCDDAEGAWEFIRSAVRPETSEESRYYRRSGIPAFKSVFNAACDEYINNNYIFDFYYDGSSSYGSYGAGDVPLNELDRPGIRTTFTEEDKQAFFDFLENKVGGMMVTSIPEEVMGIIGEEVSSYAAGVNTAENCASKIQSRVSIWLSEHE